MANDIKHYLDLVGAIFDAERFGAEPHGIYDPIEYTLRLGGKRIRPTLLLVANGMYGGDAEAARGAALGIETFHNFTLLHDDLMDRSPLRRGQPTVYRKWDENTAILSGDTMFALAWRYFLRQPSPNLRQILQCFDETAIEVCEGQQLDMEFETAADVTIDDYLRMIRLKTAVLLAASLKIGGLYADAPQAEAEGLYRVGIHLGLAFQLQDDLLDAYGDTAVFGKKTGQDIRDNKKTYLPLAALRLCDERQAADLRRLLSPQSGIDEEVKVRRVLALYDSLRLRPEVEQRIEAEFAAAHAELDGLAVPDEHKQPLRELMAMLMGRKK